MEPRFRTWSICTKLRRMGEALKVALNFERETSSRISPPECRATRIFVAEFGDVRSVMASVPGVEEKQPVHGARPVLQVDKHAAELIRGERAPKSNPTVMKRIEKSERNFDRRGFCVGELRPRFSS